MQAPWIARRERERRGAPTRVADQVDGVRARLISDAPDGLDLHCQPIVRRRCLGGVDLQVLEDGSDLLPERREQRAVGEVGGQDGAGDEDDSRALADHSALARYGHVCCSPFMCQAIAPPPSSARGARFTDGSQTSGARQGRCGSPRGQRRSRPWSAAPQTARSAPRRRSASTPCRPGCARRPHTPRRSPGS